jgi:hypothetical protein
MREVFAIARPPDPGEVFYTITAHDVGKTVIEVSEGGPIPVGPALGVVRAWDVGRRLYRVQAEGTGRWRWEAEDQGHWFARAGRQEGR